MASLAPQMQALQEKYADDKQRQQAALDDEDLALLRNALLAVGQLAGSDVSPAHARSGAFSSDIGLRPFVQFNVRPR